MNFFSRLTLKTKILLAVSFTAVICGALSLTVAIYYNQKEFREALVLKSQIIHGRLDQAAKYVAQQGGLSSVIKHYTEKYPSSDQLTEEDKKIILQQVPIYAAMKIGSAEAEKDQYHFRVFAKEPRNIKHKASAEELAIYETFLNNPSLKEKVYDDGKTVTVYRPVRLLESQGCLNCHGDPKTSPWKNGKDILGYPMENWTDGKLHGVFAISNSVQEVSTAQIKNGKTNSTVPLSIFIGVGGLGAVLIAGFVIRNPIRRLKDSTAQIMQSENIVTQSAKTIADASEQLSSANTQQSSSLEETAASLEEITSMVNKNSDNAKNAAKKTKEANAKVQDGQVIVTQVMSSMENINNGQKRIKQQIEESNNRLEENIHVIKEIELKTNIINEIVFQTKLLSFNASVEAARAGEHGKGFSVVAEEVGSLAVMSGKAAQDITLLLNQSVSKVENIITDTKSKVEGLMQDGQKRVEEGRNIAHQCEVTLHQVADLVQEVTNMMEEIASASEEQSHGIAEINKAMSELESVTQQNSATSQQAAQSSKELADQSKILQNSVQTLITSVEGDKD